MSNIKIIFQLFCLLFLSCSEQENYILNPEDSLFNSSLNIIGQDNTLDIMTWNIEHFPKNNLTNLYVKQIIDSLNIDIIGLQEIESTSYFNDLLDSLGDNWVAYRADTNSSWGELSYLINTDEINILQSPYTILHQYESDFAWRLPYVLKILYNNVECTLINIHYKCCDGSEERRLQSSIALDQYISSYLSNDKVILLGDFNDLLIDNPNVFEPFLSEPDEYYFVDYYIAEDPSMIPYWSFPSWPSHLDHILITNELFDYIVDTQTVLIDWSLIGGLNAYDTYVSDHRPVIVKILFNE